MIRKNLKKHPSGFFVDVDAHQAWIASLPRSENNCVVWPVGEYRGLAWMKISRFKAGTGNEFGRLENTTHANIWVTNQKCIAHKESPILFQVYAPNSHVDGKLTASNCFFLHSHEKAEFIPEQFLVSPARLALEAYAARINGGM
jgi:hypothetical protein